MAKIEKFAANQLLFYSTSLAASYILMRAAADSLFLSRVGNDGLATVFVTSALATALIATTWHAVTHKYRLLYVTTIAGFICSIATLGTWVLLPYLDHSWWMLATIYVLTELKGCINTINIVAASNEVLGGHSNRSAWAKVGLGVPIAMVLAGLLVGVEASIVATQTWLLLSAIVDLIALIPIANIQHRTHALSKYRKTRKRLARRTVRSGRRHVRQYVHSGKFQNWIGTLIASKVIVLTIVAFYWKTTVNTFYQSDEAALARYFGLFYFVLGVATLVLQTWITRWLLENNRLGFAILLMPLAIFVCSIALLLNAGSIVLLVALTLARLFESWRRSVNDTTLNLLYTNIDRAKRRSAIVFNVAFLKPAAEVFASSFLILGSLWVAETIIWAAFVVWIVAGILLLNLVKKGKQYLAVAEIDA